MSEKKTEPVITQTGQVTDAERQLARLLARRCVERWIREQNQEVGDDEARKEELTGNQTEVG